MDILPNGTLLLFGEFLLKSALILLPGFILSRCFRQLAPSQKHTIWMGLFVIGIAVPAALLFLPRWGVLPTLTQMPAQSPLPLEATGQPSVIVQTIGPSDPGASGVLTKASTFDLADFFFLAWATGFTLLIFRALVGAYLVSQVCKAKASVPESIDSMHREMTKHFRNGAAPRLLISANVSGPFSTGILRPKVVLPMEAIAWPEQKLRMILLHEVAHVTRRDALAVALTQLYLATNWVNPLAWFAARTATHLREEACDQHVISQGVESSQYAELLLQQASQPAAPLLQACAPAIADTTTIEKRIKTILTPNHSMKQKSNANPITVALSVLSLAVATAISVAGPKEDPFGGPEVKTLTTEEKLKSIIIPNVEFKDTPFQDALDFLQMRSVELDTSSPEKKGINLINTVPTANGALITMRLTNVPMEEAIRYTTALAQVSYRVDENAVVVIPENKEEMKTAETTAGSKEGSVNEAKLQSIQIPSLEFADTPILDALAFIQQKSMELDKDQDPDTRGINIVLESPEKIKDARITLRLRNVPLGEVLRYTTSLANSQYVVEENAIVIKAN